MSQTNYEQNYEKIFRYKDYPDDIELLFDLYIKNLKISYSDCEKKANFKLLKFIESLIGISSTCCASFRDNVKSQYDKAVADNCIFTYKQHHSLSEALHRAIKIKKESD